MLIFSMIIGFLMLASVRVPHDGLKTIRAVVFFCVYDLCATAMIIIPILIQYTGVLS